jgi:uncharacterized protein
VIRKAMPMTESEIPLFPLSGVLLPHGLMPLQIFEQRYLDLIRSCMKSDSGFGVAWILRGTEVAQRGSAAPDLGDYGTYARIVDWDQLPSGLLGITVKGGERFDLSSVSRLDNGLLMGGVTLHDMPPPSPIEPQWKSMVDVLKSLETHPHVQRMGLQVDYDNAWEVGYTLIQLLPLEEAVKYQLLGLPKLTDLMNELDGILNDISG